MIGLSHTSTVIDARQQFHDRSEEHCWQLLRGPLPAETGGQVIALARSATQQRAPRKGVA